MHLGDRIREAAARVSARLTLVGADPHDDEDLRARKALLVLISVLILPVAALWGVLYLAFGSPVGVVPLVYFGVLLGAIAVFSRTRDFPWLLRVGQVDILLAPTLSMIPLGGFLDSGGVGLWGILAPLGALVFSDVEVGDPLVRRVPRRVPRIGDRGRDRGPDLGAAAQLVHEHDAGPQHRGRRRHRVHAAGGVRQPAPRCAGRAPGGTGQGRGAPAQHPAPLDRRPAEGRDAADRGPVRVGLDPVRRRGGLHALVGAALARRGGGLPRSPVQSLRRARGEVRAREDQDDRRLLHGRRGRSDTTSRPCSRARRSWRSTC